MEKPRSRRAAGFGPVPAEVPGHEQSRQAKPDRDDDHPKDANAKNRPVKQPDGKHTGKAPAGEKGATDIAQGADPD